MTWLCRTPFAVVMAHIEMMGRLKAEESMTASVEGAMASRLNPSPGQWGRWERAARTVPAIKPKPADLRAMGIGVRKVGPRG